MDCDSVKREDLVERYLLGDLGEDQRLAFEQHYFQCSACFEELRQLGQIRQALAASPVPSARPVSKKTPATKWWRWPAFAAVAASIALAAVLLIEYRTVPVSPGADVAQSRHPQVASELPSEARTHSALTLARLAQAKPPTYTPQVLRGSDPGLPASFGQAMLAYTEGNYQQAAEGLRKAAQVNSARPDIAFFLAASELLAGNPAAARAGFEAVLALGDTAFTDEAHFYLAKAQLALGDQDAARLSLQRVSRSDIALHGEAVSLLLQLDSLAAY